MDYSAYNEVVTFITETWGLFVNGITELTEASANCFIIESNTGKLFFKVYQEKYDYQTLSNEIAVCGFLTERGFCVSTFLRSKKGGYIEDFKGRLCTLQFFIEGITYPKYEVPKGLLYDAAKVLAKINTALEELPVQLPLGFDRKWFFDWSGDREIEKLNRLLTRLNCEDEYYNRITKDFETKCKILSSFNATVFPFASLTPENTHGDYNVLQLIFSSDRVKAVVDFSSCSRIPICWELIRSYSLSSAECKYGIIDTDNFVGYINEYRKIRVLSKSDLELMPYFYLFTLLRSSFGYKGYIEKKSSGHLVEKKDLKTLEFAFWRTEMCKWLFDHADTMSSVMKRVASDPPTE